LYETTVALPDATGVLKALTGIKVTVVPRGAQDVAGSAITIYQSDTGVTPGPDPKCGATGTNPMTTVASGGIRFWADGPAEYDLVFEDTQTPARIADRVGWNSVPAKAGSFPTSMLAGDKGITLKMLADEVARQQVPIGCVIEWWRPSGSGVPYPDGFELADGHVVNQHDFYGVSGAISTPNLQNVFVLGATVGKADGTAGGSADDLASSGPGINGKGGTNKAKNLAHGHAVPGVDHTHVAGSLSTGGHNHSVSASGTTGNGNRGMAMQLGGSAEAGTFLAHTHGVTVYGSASDVGNLGVGGSTGGMNGGAATTNSATSTTTWTDPAVSGAAVDFRPQYYGLLRLIKCRRA
jgi:hypothetical protein